MTQLQSQDLCKCVEFFMALTASEVSKYNKKLWIVLMNVIFSLKSTAVTVTCCHLTHCCFAIFAR